MIRTWDSYANALVSDSDAKKLVLILDSVAQASIFILDLEGMDLTTTLLVSSKGTQQSHLIKLTKSSRWQSERYKW